MERQVCCVCNSFKSFSQSIMASHIEQCLQGGAAPSVAKPGKLIIPTTSSSTSSSSSSSSSSSFSPGQLVGRRLVYGYTLNKGRAERLHRLRFAIEDKTAQSSALSFSSTSSSVKTPTYSASQLLFTTDGGIRGRLPNCLCESLVPLLRAGTVRVEAHVAFDVGELGTFVDLPLSLFLFLQPTFFELMAGVGKEGAPSAWGGKANKGGEPLQVLGNDLLLWLAEGDGALMSARERRRGGRDKHSEMSGSSSSSSGSADMAEDEVEEGAVEVSSSMQALVDQAVVRSADLPVALQPRGLDGVTLRKYQLQALCWMQAREKKKPSLSANAASEGRRTPADATIDISDADTLSDTIDMTGDDNNQCFPPTIAAPASTVLSLPGSGLVCLPAQMPAGNSGPSDQESLWTLCAAVSIAEAALAPTATTPPLFSLADTVAAATTPSLFYWNRFSCRVQLSPPRPHMPARGGILADDMGMGKTVMALALVLSDLEEVPARGQKNLVAPPPPAVAAPPPPPPAPAGARKRRKSKLVVSDDDDDDDDDDDESCPGKIPRHVTSSSSRTNSSNSSTNSLTALRGAQRQGGRGGTLVVAPLTLLAQWVGEVQAKAKGLTVLLYYGPSAQARPAGHGGVQLALSAYDVVVTSYGVLASQARVREEIKEGGKGTILSALSEGSGRAGLLDLVWRRIICDEAHNLKNPSTYTAKACYALKVSDSFKTNESMSSIQL